MTSVQEGTLWRQVTRSWAWLEQKSRIERDDEWRREVGLIGLPLTRWYRVEGTIKIRRTVHIGKTIHNTDKGTDTHKQRYPNPPPAPSTPLRRARRREPVSTQAQRYPPIHFIAFVVKLVMVGGVSFYIGMQIRSRTVRRENRGKMSELSTARMILR
jgi:hypothetical protein